MRLKGFSYENGKLREDMKQFYKNMKGKKKQIKSTSPIYLSQKDFQEGTLLLETPGYYRLSENIVFSPNAGSNYFPRDDQQQYKTLGFSLGFFAALAIYGDGIYLDLNGFSISASREFQLQQRFFSIIELANSPFLTGQGPGSFSNSSDYKAASNVIIANGTLGRSSHHGIHGNLVTNILIEDLTIRDFEFVGIAINGIEGLGISNVTVKDSIKDSAVLATYSAARFSLLFADKVLKDGKLPLALRRELEKKRDALRASTNKTFKEVIENGETTDPLFKNVERLPDGNMYGILVKDGGVAINELVTPSPTVVKSQGVYLRGVKVENIKGRVDEVLSLSQKGGKGAQTDTAGAVFQIDRLKTEEGLYKGTVLSDLQICLAETASSLSVPLGKNNITGDVISWTKTGGRIEELLQTGYEYKCGGDSMFHLNKGIFAYRIDAVNELVIKDSSYKDVRNKGRLGNDKAAGKYERSHDACKRSGYLGAASYGINLSYVSNCLIEGFKGDGLRAKNGNAIGINVIFGCQKISLSDITLSWIWAGRKVTESKEGKKKEGKEKKWKGKNYWNQTVSYEDGLPNGKPQAIGLQYEKGMLMDIKDLSVHSIKSCFPPEKIKTIQPLKY